MPKTPTQFLIKTKNGESVIGSSTLPTIVCAAAIVFEHPDKIGELERASALSAALNSAQEGGADAQAIKEAYELGEKIGLKVRGRNQIKAKDRPMIIAV